ncbi:MAG: DUF420 domain-containing protein [Haloarculaceae archaeon]
MSTLDKRLLDSPSLRDHAVGVTVVLTLFAYAVVGATFAGALPYPTIGEATVDLLGTVIAALNAVIFALLSYGWYSIRQGEVRRHRGIMLTSVVLILAFLLMYLEKVGGGGIKEFVGPAWVRNYVYFPMLGIHELLSAVAVPLVIYALVLGLTHTPAELRETSHRRFGWLAVTSWLLSLGLGVITYLLLNVVYGWTYTTSLPY